MAKKRVGRPSLYKPEFAELARKLRLFGATDEQIAGVKAAAEGSPATEGSEP